MAEIRPFRGVRYNQQVISNLEKVICPPYDIIDSRQQDELYKSSEFNFVRIEYNRELPQDTGNDNRYTRAAAFLSGWLEKGILQADSEPAIYVHEHQFSCQGKKYKRQNLIALVRLEEWDKNIIRPHENIIPRAKSDRMSMLRACQANTSPVLSMFQDPKKIISAVLADQEKNQPQINVKDTGGEIHSVWAITQPEAVRQIQKVIADQPIYIADGHHRYDSALTYRREKAEQTHSLKGEEGFNFVMMSLMEFDDPGMVILPPHRLIRGIHAPVLSGLKSQLQAFFDIEELPLSAPDVWQKVDSRLTGMKPDMSHVSLAVYGLKGNQLQVLTLREYDATNRLMPLFHGDLYKKLDVSLVDHVILEKLLAFDKDKEDITLAYSYDRLDAVNKVKNQEYQLVFILNPVKPEVIKSIADAGDRMPRKSTYFYPKSPAGLVFYKWQQG